MNVIQPGRYDPVSHAIDRDRRDSERLRRLDRLVADLMDALIPDLHPLEHPHARWCPDDLLDALQWQRKSIGYELQRTTRGMVVIGPDDWEAA